ncbi:hypothetical protein P261_00515 [Lachnospiraceae bacterium TWA4]|nr:hypothetical protein P261_00515 [Lachnospiraceae bacterium TWA4]
MNDESNRVSIKETAKLLETTEQFVRIALQQEMYPFGFAMKKEGSNNYCYYVNRQQLYNYINGTKEDKGVENDRSES